MGGLRRSLELSVESLGFYFRDVFGVSCFEIDGCVFEGCAYVEGVGGS